MLANIPHRISEITKIHWLENSLQRCPQFDITIGTWKSTNTSVSTRTYNDVVQYLSAQYSSLSPDTPSRGRKAFGVSDDSNTINHGQRKNKKRRRGKDGKGKGQNGNGQSGNPKRQRQQQATQAHAVTETEDDPDYSGQSNGWEGPAAHGHGRTTAPMDCHTFCFTRKIRRSHTRATNQNGRPSVLLRRAWPQHHTQCRQL
jgi:hypothetical protein